MEAPRTPMMRQYFAAKAEHPGVLLAMRVGDFYEFYGQDAEIAAEALEITLTGRDDGDERIPMAGVPFHAVEKYLARLIQAGHKVALCDQLEDPKTAKGLIKRGVTRVLTPGTVLEESMLEGTRNNFLAALCARDGGIGLAYLDPSTGEFAATELEGDEAADRLVQELARLRPAEVLVEESAESHSETAATLGSLVSKAPAPRLDRAKHALLRQFQVSDLAGFGCECLDRAIVAASMVLGYAERNGLALSHVTGIRSYSVESYMRLDVATRRSLELTQNLADGSRRHTLLSVLDQTRTSMGARLLRRWVEQPLLEAEEIASRQNAIASLADAALVRSDIRDEVSRVADIERLVSRCSAGIAGPRDLASLRESLGALPRVKQCLERVASAEIERIQADIDPHAELRLALENALVKDPPHSVRDGGVIQPGYDGELDELRDLAKGGRKYIAELESRERERTGISSLKVGFNSVFGYYLEVPKSQVAKTPEHYIRKQTTANSERYITAELKEHESQVLGAEEKALALEAEIFSALRKRVATEATRLLSTARALARLDVLSCLAEVARTRRYVRPEIVREDCMEIRDGRHPVVETAVPGFVPNDLRIACRAEDAETLAESGEPPTRLVVLTGPNMSGKSTYLRQNALIVLMAQIGSFVPASRCRLGLCDRIFARIGARDELALGQSTFMVEMLESANILNHATSKSLVILDEVGRGTSTFDGMAIAWAMAEHLTVIGCKTLFATHYHQLNALAEQLPEVANFRVSVEELGDEIVWTHRVVPGGADRSYGVHVARMAGVPIEVVRRAAEVLRDLESADGGVRATAPQTRKLQLTLFEMEKPRMLAELEGLDINQMTPIQALVLLETWKSEMKASREE